jgi:diguanylate cyclase (GGDEF)-like protein/PAS domain S-box-containing protein
MKHIAKRFKFKTGFQGFQLRHWSTAITFAVGLAATLAVVLVMWRTEAQKANGQLTAQIDTRVKTISFEIRRYDDLVKAVQAYAEGSHGPIGLSEYSTIVSRLLRDREGIQALNYAPRVLSSERSAFEAKARDQGLIDFRIMEGNSADGVRIAGDRTEYFPLFDVYPTKGNEVALGLDVTSARVPIFNVARDSGNDIASPPFRLIGQGDQWAFLLVCPVYGPLTANTVEERHAKIKGYAIGTFRIGDMFESILQNAPVARGFDFYIFDGSPDHRGQLLHVHSSESRKASKPAPPFDQIRLSDAHVAELMIDQHEWTIVIVPLEKWYSVIPGGGVIVALILGLMGTGIGTLYVDSTRRYAAYSKTLTNELRESENRLQTIFTSVREGIFVTDPDTSTLIEVNPAGCELFGYRRDELIGRSVAALSSGESGYTKSAGMALLERAVAGEHQLFEWQYEAKDGRLFWAEISRHCVLFGGKIVALATIRDTTERRQIQEHLIDVARNDGLTGLFNRTAFLEALQHAAARARRGEHFFGVLYLDLDHFKDINDTLGHPIGDLVLKAVADRLRAHVRETDTVARFGGDEFAVLAPELHDPTDAGVLALKLVEAIREPLVIQGNVIRTATSIGIAIFDIDSPIVETLLAHADLAMYRAKQEGRSGYKFFAESMDTEVRDRVLLATDLRDAIASENLVLHYQPQVDMASGRIVGVEALVRWPHPTRGMLAPAMFIAAAEKSGLIIQLGRWILRKACRQAKTWLDDGIPPIVIGVNVSAIQLRNPLELEKDIVAILAETRLPAHYLELELTETALMEASREHNDVLQRIHDLGVKLAIDDFGTGYSSLDYLRRFPVDRIKIAQTFVADITSDIGDVAIVKATIGLARELKINLIAEGVETQGQRDLLIQWGCSEAQGFYFSEPLTSNEAQRHLRAGIIVTSRGPRAMASAGAITIPVTIAR